MVNRRTSASPRGVSVRRSSEVKTSTRVNVTRRLTGSLPVGNVYSHINWIRADAVIKSASGETVFEQKDVEFPDYFSQTAINIAVQHYFKGRAGTPERETSLKQVIDRVADTISDWGVSQKYFLSEEEAADFRDELKYILVHQMASFNSPVYYNVGVKQECQGWAYDLMNDDVKPIQKGEHRPQGSACFILKVEDNMASILNWYVEEGMVFKFGSGAGLNISPIRSKAEYLRGGGKPSGPLSFAKAADVSAGTIKSGGKTRRAAKMLIMNIDHPDIEEFIWCKSKEEKKARALIEAGYSSEFNVDGGAYESVFFQNANNSVRVNDDFMRALTEKKTIPVKAVMDGRPLTDKSADDLMHQVATAAWTCGDPGIQYDSQINKMNTCLDTERINASNPCSEYMFLDNTACNLASANLMKFYYVDEQGKPSFNKNDFRHVCEVMAMAQEILVPNAGYPTEKIAERSYYYRTLGLGYANLGSLLMHYGFPYDSEEGRELAANVTSLMSASAYRMSAEIAERKGPFPKFLENQRSTVRVMRHHLHSAEAMDDYFGSVDIWAEVCDKAMSTGLRNAQISVLAPTGTIGFLMDCDTTGVEPELALVKYKKMVGGGQMKLVNSGVSAALTNLGYDEHNIEAILSYIQEKGTIEDAPFFRTQDLAVFDCSFPAQGFTRCIHYDGHIKMMGAVQPFISGAISKTVNMPETSTVEEIKEVYKKAWKLGLKAVAVYRDNCKASQPMSTGQALAQAARAKQRKMPSRRQAVIHEFKIGNHKGFLTIGLYEDGTPGEIFIDMSKEGSTVSGLLDSTAIAVSYALQYGVPLDKFIEKYSHMRFEPSGFTGNQDLPIAESIIDYVFRYLDKEFSIAPKVPELQLTPATTGNLDGPICDGCGNSMTRNGSCYKCGNCGKTSGCS